MGARATTLLAALAAAAAITGCGGSGSVTGTGGGNSKATTAVAPSAAKTPSAGLQLTKIGDFAEPVYINQPEDDRRDLFVVEKGGTIRVVRDGETLPKPFLDVSDLVSSGSEQGLLSMAFSPDYADSGLFYIDYTDPSGDTRVVEYRRSKESPVRADPASARVVLRQDQPYENHNGGQLQFGPDDLLYVGFGDGGSAGDPDRNAQDPGTFLGKIVSLNPGDPAPRAEIYATGLRNPWRFSFELREGVVSLAIGDVGQDEFEEVDYVGDPAPGMNFGWSAFEANARYNADQEAPGAIPPALSYSHAEGCSVTGGYVISDPRLGGLQGDYVYGDYCAGQLRSFSPARRSGETGGPGRADAYVARDDHALGLEVAQLTSFGEDSRHRIYAASQAGPVYRIDPEK